MNRRTALKYVTLSGAAAMLLPGCLTDKKKVSVALNNLQITAEDEALLAELADTILPAAGDTPGAKQLETHLFTLVMVDDCTAPGDKDKFMKGLRQFNGAFGSEAFMDITPEKRFEALTAFEKDIDSKDEALKYFYSTARGYTIYGFTTSQYFLSEVRNFKLVPGPVFHGCVPVSDNV
jgi:Gluconate 2-dehydrogenase subunit 3